MSDLPQGWIATTIGDVTSPIEQRAPSNGIEFKYVDIASIDRDTKRITESQVLNAADAPSRARKIIKTGDVLVSMTRPNLNAVAMVSAELDGEIASTGFDVLRANEIDSRWLFNIVKSSDFVSDMSTLVQGALYPAIKSADVRSYQIPLAPLPEQKRIADKLDTVLARVDACRERLNRVTLILKRFKQSVLATGTSGKLTEDWRAKNVDLTMNDAIESQSEGEIRDWNQVSLSEICQSITDGDHQAPPQAKNGIPFITISAINDGQLRIEKASRYVPREYFEQLKSTRKPAKGDVLYSVTGSICIPALVSDELEFTFQRHIAILKPNLNKITSKYLYFVLGSENVKKQGFESATGTAQLTLSLNSLRSLSIYMPPMGEQQEIVRRVETLFAFADRLEARLNTARDAAERLTPALLAKAFRGELVDQDPNDEPAEVLLKRIQSVTPIKENKISSPRKVMTKLNAESVKAAIQEMQKKRFSFDELRTLVPGDYDAMKDILFLLMSETTPLIRQIFDEEAKKMIFEKV